MFAKKNLSLLIKLNNKNQDYLSKFAVLSVKNELQSENKYKPRFRAKNNSCPEIEKYLQKMLI
jgi:hypothetical protein